MGKYFMSPGEMPLHKELETLRARNDELETKCKKLEEAFRKSEDRFSKIFHESSNLMTITRIDDGCVLDLNEASAKLGGFTREEMIGTSPSKHGLWADPHQRNEVVRKLREEGSVHNIPVDFLGKEKELHRVLFSATPVTIDDESCILSVSVDITPQIKETEALRESEEKYRMLIENSLQGIAVIQNDHIVFCNQTFADITGYSVEELYAIAKIWTIVHEDDREETERRSIERSQGIDTLFPHEFQLVRKDGSIRWQLARGSHIDLNGMPAMQVAMIDITERKLAELALKESEDRFRLITNTIDEIFYIFDAESGTALYLSPTFERIWGYPAEKALNREEPFINPVHPEDREKVMNWGPTLKSSKQPVSYEYRIVRADGSIRYIWDQGYPILNKEGEVQFFVGTGRDVTAWRLAEKALRESQEYLNNLINCIGDPILVKDRDHKLLLINDAFCSQSRLKREDLIGKTALEDLPQDYAQSLLKGEEEVFVTGKEHVTEDVMQDDQGRTITLLTKKSLLRDKAGNLQLVLAIRDISEYKRLEAQFLQSQKMEAIGVLAGGVAHDFNNLLNVINGYGELILDALHTEDPVRKDVEQIQEAGQRAAALTAQLLAFGRKQIMQPETIDLNLIITQMSSMLRRLIGEDIEFIVQPLSDLGMIHADPSKIQQVLLNLVVNARDAMPEGGTLTLETLNVNFEDSYIKDHPVANPGDYVMMAISDNGIGMDAQTQAHIFEPFFTTKAKGKGSGLGLATVYGIVKQSGGYIWVYSEPGKGTTFKIYFPRLKAACTSSIGPQPGKTDSRGFETILVVEDETAVRMLAVRILQDRGYHVLEAAQGSDALRIAEEFKEKIHMVVTDVIMPGMSGKTMVTHLETKRPDIKVLFISGYTDNAIVHHGMLDSNVAFLQKPFSIEGLTRKVREVLDAGEQQAAGRTRS
jgi:two-component system, cell cycle sensor histidine kinase and response regulator CckA